MRYGTVDREFAVRLATFPEELDGPVLMVNFMKYRERADYGDGNDDGVSGREADDRYTPLDVLAAIGARVVYAGDALDDAAWDRVGIVRYPTRRSFIAMQQRDDFKAKHVHKDAGMAFTINLTAVPTGPLTGARPAGDVVTFAVWPEGAAPPAPATGDALLAVEGRVLGDERRWGHLGVHFGEHVPEPTGGAMLVRTRATLDRLHDTLASWPLA